MPFSEYGIRSALPISNTGHMPSDLETPSGALIANLTAAYDTFAFRIYTSTAIRSLPSNPGGNLDSECSANSLNDGFEIQAQGLQHLFHCRIVTSPLSYWPFVLAVS